MVGLDIGKSSHNKQNVDKEMVGLDIGKSSHHKQNVDKEMVGLDIDKSSHNKQKKLRSDVWKMFEKCKDKDGKDLAKCSLCEKLFDGSSKKGTTHLRNHFKICQKKRNEGGASGTVDKPAGNSVMDQHLDRVKMLIKKQCYQDLPDIDIINVYEEEKEKLRMYFEKLCCRFSLMIKNMTDGKYTSFVVRFIDDDWKLEEKIIGFKCIERGENMRVLKNVLLDLGIYNNISSMVTVDDSDIYVLSSDKGENRFSGEGSLLSICKFCVLGLDYIDQTCSRFEDLMGKVLYEHMSKICNYITETSKTGTFQIAMDRARSLGKEVTAEDIPTKEKLENMSWLDLCKIAMGLQEAFFKSENMDSNFKSINLTKEQWDVIMTFYQFYDENDFGHINWDLLDCKTANMYFLVLCRLYKKSFLLVTHISFIGRKIYLHQFKSAAEKCWNRYNLILAVAAVLDPRFKMDIVKHWYKKIYGDECETRLEIFTNYFTGVYNEYAKGTNNFQSSTLGSKEKDSSISYRVLDFSGKSSHDHSGQSLNSELHLYLEYVKFPLIEEFDLLEWWRLNSRYFPTLAKMARDFLSIRITVASDLMYLGIYSPDKDFDSDIVKEAFMCTKSWLTNEEAE
ncbi:hypothetical protein LWI29_005717 [Acer saccharum]|uniref:BED-type domain-containing protein n=1 Tax=Acer saccharum TaxID=4024 RepID=A0AA39SXT3_ACESA|nr:hypothetical protein LWI29_005717 [Acer saccharum]